MGIEGSPDPEIIGCDYKCAIAECGSVDDLLRSGSSIGQRSSILPSFGHGGYNELCKSGPFEQ
jgi:hypothetical protein